MIIGTDTELPAPLAEGAAIATRHVGPCAICHYAVLRGDRYALLVPSGNAAHLFCIARGGPRRW